jgi:hypothetical protein
MNTSNFLDANVWLTLPEAGIYISVNPAGSAELQTASFPDLKTFHLFPHSPRISQ